ncbi:MAG: sigma-70 family RNA polymerase sigma factor [Anaerolineales bacterium]
MASNEVQLLEGARRLDESALAEIYDSLSPELYYYACRLVGDTETAEDVVSETFFRFLRALGAGGGPEDHLRAYLYRIVHNLAVDHHRRQTEPLENQEPDMQRSSSAENPDDAVELSLAQAQAREVLWRLTHEQRQVIMLKFFQGLSNEEIAAVLEKPVGAVKSLQHRGLKSMRRILENDFAFTEGSP